MPKLCVCSCQSQQPRNRIESLEGLSVSLVCGNRLYPARVTPRHRRFMQQVVFPRSRPCWVHGVLVAMPPAGSRVQCVHHQLLVRALPGAASIKISASARCGTVARCPKSSLVLPLEPPICIGTHISWFDPAFQLVVVSNSVRH